jgi:hypothetical protein
MLRSITTRVAGLAILILGIWGGIIPFVGPYFHFTLGPDHTWVWTAGRFYLNVLPAIAAVIGGLLLMGAGPWAAGRLGALLALLAGFWFAIGADLSLLWHTGGQAGAAHGGATRQALERLSFHSGLGVLITALAAYSLPGVLVARRTRPAEPLPRERAAPATTAADAPATGTVDRPAEPVAADGKRERVAP